MNKDKIVLMEEQTAATNVAEDKRLAIESKNFVDTMTKISFDNVKSTIPKNSGEKECDLDAKTSDTLSPHKNSNEIDDETSSKKSCKQKLSGGRVKADESTKLEKLKECTDDSATHSNSPTASSYGQAPVSRCAESVIGDRKNNLVSLNLSKCSNVKLGGAGSDPFVQPRRKKRKAKVNCALCSTCPCSRGTFPKVLDGEEPSDLGNTNSMSGLACCEAEVELALIGRLKRLERSSAWFKQLSQKVHRQLKRHRSKIIKRTMANMETREGVAEEKPRFLQDVEMDDVVIEKYSAPPLAPSVTDKAQVKLFSFRRTVVGLISYILDMRDWPYGTKNNIQDVNQLLPKCLVEKMMMLTMA